MERPVIFYKLMWNQCVNRGQSTNQIDYSTGQWASHSLLHSFFQSVSQSVSKSATHLVSQSVNQYLSQEWTVFLCLAQVLAGARRILWSLFGTHHATDGDQFQCFHHRNERDLQSASTPPREDQPTWAVPRHNCRVLPPGAKLGLRGPCRCGWSRGPTVSVHHHVLLPGLRHIHLARHRQERLPRSLEAILHH